MGRIGWLGCALVTLLFSLACVGGDSVSGCDVLITNEYAESLFFLDVEVDGERFGIADDVRLDIFEDQLFRDAVEAEDGEPIVFHFSAMSLGEMQEFGAIRTEMDTYGTYAFTYEFDLATGGFSVGHGWE